MEKVFISYSRHDSQLVDRITNDLNHNGVETWIDTENINPGESWQKAIEQGLKKVSSLVFVISKNSLKSSWMLHELSSFLGANNKKVFPVIIEDIDTSQLPPFISNIQWIDFRQNYDSGLKKLLRGLGIKQKVRAITTPPQKLKRNKGYAFLSYTEQDVDFITSLKVFLKEHGFAYWDYEESDRDYHNQLFLELEGVINEATVTLSILSETWKRSQWTVKEFFFSQEIGTPVFLLKAKELGPTLAIAGMTYIDFTKDENAGFTKLVKELKRKRL